MFGLVSTSSWVWAISSVVERFLHTEEATGSIPVSPTISFVLSVQSYLSTVTALP